jgi:1,4-alpha-glucan branching enzyme
VLGPFATGDRVLLRTFQPGARAVEAVARDDGRILAGLDVVDEGGLFAGEIPAGTPYLLRIHWHGGVQETEDPYAFGLLLGDLDLHLIAEGRHRELGQCLGAHVVTVDGVRGVRFAVWAPNARRVSVVGDFNSWDGRRHPMRLRHDAGIWELFMPRLEGGERYKFEIVGAHGQTCCRRRPIRSRAHEVPPSTASVVAPVGVPLDRRGVDEPARGGACARQADVDLRGPSGLVAATRGRPYGHARLGPARRAAHPLRHRSRLHASRVHAHRRASLRRLLGLPAALALRAQRPLRTPPRASRASSTRPPRRARRDRRLGAGPFPDRPHGLARFDGTALYEHEDPREGYHQDWNTYIYNLGRREVQGFLIASALYWLERFHIDGLRVDAVASMLYRDYSRAARASGCPTSTAGARTSNRSISCAG